MKLSSLMLYFVTGGLFTAIIVTLEEIGQRTLSGLATLGSSVYPRRIFLRRSNCGAQCSQSAREMGAGRHPGELGALHACDCVPRTKGRLPQSHSCESGDLLHPSARVHRSRQPSQTLSITRRGTRLAYGRWLLSGSTEDGSGSRGVRSAAAVQGGSPIFSNADGKEVSR